MADHKILLFVAVLCVYLRHHLQFRAMSSKLNTLALLLSLCKKLAIFDSLSFCSLMFYIHFPLSYLVLQSPEMVASSLASTLHLIKRNFWKEEGKSIFIDEGKDLPEIYERCSLVCHQLVCCQVSIPRNKAILSGFHWVLMTYSTIPLPTLVIKKGTGGVDYEQANVSS